MKTASAKNKGRALQKIMVNMLLQYFPSLTTSDIRSTSMGATGEDLLLSSAAKALLPFRWECKNQEGLKGIYDHYEQAASHPGVGEPILVIKMNRKRPLVLIDADYFVRTLRGAVVPVKALIEE